MVEPSLFADDLNVGVRQSNQDVIRVFGLGK